MAAHSEMDQFIRKFVSLWESGCEASLHLESKAGQAYVNLRLGLGPAQTHPAWKNEHGGCHRGGGPAQQRRRERRRAERQSRATAEEAEAAAMENAAEQGDLEKKEIIIEEVNEPQDVTKDVSSETIEYELKVESHVKCKNYDVVEAIEVNFDGTIDDLKIDKTNICREILVSKLESEIKIEDEGAIMWRYRVTIKNCDVAQNILESWKERYKFDDLAFRNAVYGTGMKNIGRVNVRIAEVTKL